MEYLQYGIEVRYFVGNEERSGLVYLVDYKNPDKNSFIIANQWSFVENSTKRPDILLFLNGIPIVLMEHRERKRMLRRHIHRFAIICMKFHLCLFTIVFVL